MAQTQPEQTDRAQRRGMAVAVIQGDARIMLADCLDQPGGGTGVQAVRQRDDRFLDQHHAIGVGFGGLDAQRHDAQQRIADRNQPLGDGLDGIAGGIGDDDRRDDGGGVLDQIIEVEADQRLARQHLRARLYLRRQPLAAQRHGVDTDMADQLITVGAAQRDRMARLMHGQHGRVAGGAQRVVDRIDRNTVAQHLFGKDRVRHLGERRHPACQRGINGQVTHRTSLSPNCIPSP